MADEQDEGFKITDRRGRPVESAAADAPSVSEIRETSEILAAPPGPAAPQAAPPPGGRGRPGQLDLQELFVMFASSALIGLGAAPNPVTGERTVDLEQAEEAIDTLLLLRDKTQGNRSEPESRLLEEILYDLQLRFVQGSGPSPRR